MGAFHILYQSRGRFMEFGVPWNEQWTRSTRRTGTCMNESSRRRMREGMWTSHARDQTLGSECSSSNGPCPIDEESRARNHLYMIYTGLRLLRCVSLIDSTRGSGGKSGRISFKFHKRCNAKSADTGEWGRGLGGLAMKRPSDTQHAFLGPVV
jgi:hypothetical protein